MGKESRTNRKLNCGNTGPVDDLPDKLMAEQIWRLYTEGSRAGHSARKWSIEFSPQVLLTASVPPLIGSVTWAWACPHALYLNKIKGWALVLEFRPPWCEKSVSPVKPYLEELLSGSSHGPHPHSFRAYLIKTDGY